MALNYGSIKHEQKQPKRISRVKAIIAAANEPVDKLSPEALEKRLASLAFQNKAPSVAKAAAAELLERKAPKTKNVDQGLTASDARRICDIYDRIFVTGQ